MPVPNSIHQLVKCFEEHLDSYRSGGNNETKLHRELLDPFFEALGWDVFNKQGYAETYKDVIQEESLEIEGATKQPDFAFRIEGGRKFFVEAKKPAVKARHDKMVSLVERMLELTPSFPPKWGEEKVHARSKSKRWSNARSLSPIKPLTVSFTSCMD